MIDFDVVVIGSGAAAYNAACRVAQGSKKSVCIVTEGVRMGTSRNTGSDRYTTVSYNKKRAARFCFGCPLFL